MEAKELTQMDNVTALSVRVTQTSLTELTEQRSLLKQFIKTQLEEGVDFGIIPGTPKPSLYKPGAEKLANIFQLGSRIIKSDKTLDIPNNFAMFEVTIETFHLPTGKAISQSSGIANSQEIKYKERSRYEGKGENRKYLGKEATPIGDVLNTLTKMAQKRAYVGAVIIATGASDFFTQDMEDGPGDAPSQPKSAGPIPNKPAVTTAGVDLGKFVITFGQKYKGMTLDSMGKENVTSYRQYFIEDSAKTKKPLGGAVKEFVEVAGKWIG